MRLIWEQGGLRIGQCDGNRSSGPVGVSNGKIGVFGAAALIPHLCFNRPVSQVDGSIAAVFELQRDTVIRPALQADVVCAWCDRHGNILAFALTDTFLAPMVGA